MASGKLCLQTFRLLFILIFVFCKIVNGEEDYYAVLGINRNANSEQIKRAYRTLAREWHPDKSTDSDAQEKFIKINKAYETLSDSKKREDYDRYGHSGPPKHHEQQFQFFHDSEYMFFNEMPFQYQSNWRHQDFTTLNYYKKTILPESYRKIYLLQIVSDWCFNCAAVEEIWEHTTRDLKLHGVGIGLVNKNVDPRLARELGVRKLPDFVAVINSKLYHYTGAVGVENLKNFVSGLFPKDLVHEVTASNLNQFLKNWYENRPRALLFTTKAEAPLLLKIVAFKYQHHVGVGYVQLSKSENQEIRARYGAARYEPTFMIFKENISQPDILLQASDLHTGTLDDSVSSNLYLYFPRLSSQEMFTNLCPEERSTSRKSLCVILFTNTSPNLEHSLPSMSKDKSWRSKRVRFVYVNPGVQKAFESSIRMNEKSRTICRNKLRSKKVAILWRFKDREVKYTWLENGWCGPKDVARISDLLDDIQEGDAELEMSAVAGELYNEHAKSIPAQVVDLYDDLAYYSIYYINWSGHLPTLSLAITFGFVFLISCIFPSITDKGTTKSSESSFQSHKTSGVYGLVQLNSNSQDRLIHKSPQGKLVVVLLSDATSDHEALRSPVVQAFSTITRPYQKESIFTFAWLSIPEHIAWCNEVMKVQTFGEITAGTVLVLNGAKKYLSIFKIQERPRDQDAGNVFDDSEDDDAESSTMVFREDKRTQKRTANELSRQFPWWIEKLLEGMVPRLKLDGWPKLECDK